MDRLILWFRLIPVRVRRFFANSAAPPSKIGKAKEGEYRPIPIEIGFYLHATGRVYQRSRSGDGDRRVDNPEVIGMVHAEYREMVKLAEKEMTWAAQLRRKLRIARRALSK